MWALSKPTAMAAMTSLTTSYCEASLKVIFYTLHLAWHKTAVMEHISRFDIDELLVHNDM